MGVTTAGLAAALMARADRLGAISEEDGLLVRRPLTAAARVAEDAVAAWMGAAGADVARDATGNVFGRRVGAATGPALVVGSHLDTVRDAGRYDGPLGVLLAIAALEYVAAREVEGDPPLPFPLEVVAFAGEEGARWAPFLGSRVATGTMPADWPDRIDEDGISLARAVRDAGGDPGTLGPAHARYRRGDVLAYLEPHVEQGPVLDQAGEALGVVPAIVGQARLRLAFAGQANHAGTTPMRARRDALAGAAEVVLAAERVARAMPGLVATVGQVTVAPGAANVVPGAATVSLDVRHPTDIHWQVGTGIILDAARAAATARSLALDVSSEMEVAATPCDAALVEAVQAAAVRTGMGALRVVPSGAGHDAVVMAAVGPVGLLFVRSPGGISHHPAEAARPEDVLAALRVLLAAIDEVAARVRSGRIPVPAPAVGTGRTR